MTDPNNHVGSRANLAYDQDPPASATEIPRKLEAESGKDQKLPSNKLGSVDRDFESLNSRPQLSNGKARVASVHDGPGSFAGVHSTHEDPAQMRHTQ